jgi:hypothetical protein
MPTSLISDGWPIGDPFGKDSSRTLLTGAEIGANTCTSVTCATSLKKGGMRRCYKRRAPFAQTGY